MQEKTSCCLCRPWYCIKCFVGNPSLKQHPSEYKHSSLGLWDLLPEVPSEACQHPWVFFLNLCLFYAVNTHMPHLKLDFLRRHFNLCSDLSKITSDIWSHRSFLGLRCRWNETNSSPSDSLEQLFENVLFKKKPLFSFAPLRFEREIKRKRK